MNPRTLVHANLPAKLVLAYQNHIYFTTTTISGVNSLLISGCILHPILLTNAVCGISPLAARLS